MFPHWIAHLVPREMSAVGRALLGGVLLVVTGLLQMPLLLMAATNLQKQQEVMPN